MSDVALPHDCPCHSGFPFAACCAPYLAGIAPAPTAQALMRSRYTAYVLARTAYLLDTWHPSTRPQRLHVDGARRWLGLQIRDVSHGDVGDTKGQVEFVARFKVAGRAHRLHERSTFCYQDGRWYYLHGAMQ